MTMYKVLYLDEHRKKALSAIVHAADGERWGSLIDALNDLGSIGFDVHTPIYGLAPETAAGQIIEAFLLASRTATPLSDLERRIKRNKGFGALIAEAERHLTTLSSEMEKNTPRAAGSGAARELQELEQRLVSVTKAAERTEGSGSARMTELAQQAARHFEQNKFDEALPALKELQKLTQHGDKT